MVLVDRLPSTKVQIILVHYSDDAHTLEHNKEHSDVTVKILCPQLSLAIRLLNVSTKREPHIVIANEVRWTLDIIKLLRTYNRKGIAIQKTM